MINDIHLWFDYGSSPDKTCHAYCMPRGRCWEQQTSHQNVPSLLQPSRRTALWKLRPIRNLPRSVSQALWDMLVVPRFHKTAVTAWRTQGACSVVLVVERLSSYPLRCSVLHQQEMDGQRSMAIPVSPSMALTMCAVQAVRKWCVQHAALISVITSTLDQSRATSTFALTAFACSLQVQRMARFANQSHRCKWLEAKHPAHLAAKWWLRLSYDFHQPHNSQVTASRD